MKSAKTTIGLFLATLPILYFGGMAYFIWGAPQRLEQTVGLPSGATGGMMKDIGPAVIGLGAFALLFAFGFAIRLVRASSRVSVDAGPADVDGEEGEPFDADAALARYMARKASGADPVAETPPTAPSAMPRGFGRKSF